MPTGVAVRILHPPSALQAKLGRPIQLRTLEMLRAIFATRGCPFAAQETLADHYIRYHYILFLKLYFLPKSGKSQASAHGPCAASRHRQSWQQSLYTPHKTQSSRPPSARAPPKCPASHRRPRSIRSSNASPYEGALCRAHLAALSALAAHKLPHIRRIFMRHNVVRELTEEIILEHNAQRHTNFSGSNPVNGAMPRKVSTASQYAATPRGSPDGGWRGSAEARPPLAQRQLAPVAQGAKPSLRSAPVPHLRLLAQRKQRLPTQQQQRSNQLACGARTPPRQPAALPSQAPQLLPASPPPPVLAEVHLQPRRASSASAPRARAPTSGRSGAADASCGTDAAVTARSAGSTPKRQLSSRWQSVKLRMSPLDVDATYSTCPSHPIAASASSMVPASASIASHSGVLGFPSLPPPSAASGVRLQHDPVSHQSRAGTSQEHNGVHVRPLLTAPAVNSSSSQQHGNKGRTLNAMLDATPVVHEQGRRTKPAATPSGAPPVAPALLSQAHELRTSLKSDADSKDPVALASPPFSGSHEPTHQPARTSGSLTRISSEAARPAAPCRKVPSLDRNAIAKAQPPSPPFVKHYVRTAQWKPRSAGSAPSKSRSVGSGVQPPPGARVVVQWQGRCAALLTAADAPLEVLSTRASGEHVASARSRSDSGTRHCGSDFTASTSRHAYVRRTLRSEPGAASMQPQSSSGVGARPLLQHTAPLHATTPSPGRAAGRMSMPSLAATSDRQDVSSMQSSTGASSAAQPWHMPSSRHRVTMTRFPRQPPRPTAVLESAASDNDKSGSGPYPGVATAAACVWGVKLRSPSPRPHAMVEARHKAGAPAGHCSIGQQSAAKSQQQNGAGHETSVNQGCDQNSDVSSEGFAAFSSGAPAQADISCKLAVHGQPIVEAHDNYAAIAASQAGVPTHAGMPTQAGMLTPPRRHSSQIGSDGAFRQPSLRLLHTDADWQNRPGNRYRCALAPHMMYFVYAIRLEILVQTLVKQMTCKPTSTRLCRQHFNSRATAHWRMPPSPPSCQSSGSLGNIPIALSLDNASTQAAVSPNVVEDAALNSAIAAQTGGCAVLRPADEPHTEDGTVYLADHQGSTHRVVLTGVRSCTALQHPISKCAATQAGNAGI